jgi:hypothetical protein
VHRILIVCVALAACSGGSGPTAIEVPIARIDIASNDCIGVVEGDTCTIVARAFGTNGTQIGNPVMRWFTSHPAIAEVQNGRVTARSPGTATITVTNSTASVSAEATVRVLQDTNK